MVRLPFEREARYAIAAAFELAAELRHSQVGPEHLLFGVRKAAPHLLPAEPPAEHLKSLVSELAGAEEEDLNGLKSYTPEANRILALAQEKAIRRGEAFVGYGQLISALQSAQGRVAQSMLEEVGLEPLSEKPRPTSEAPALDFGEIIRVSDAADLPFPDQIVGRVKTAVAEGRLIPGDRLPSIRALADMVSLAPGTVAKAYKRLESEDIVITAGSAGTVVAAPRASRQADQEDRVGKLAELLRPVAVQAFHLGSNADELHEALRVAIHGLMVAPSSGWGVEQR